MTPATITHDDNLEFATEPVYEEAEKQLVAGENQNALPQQVKKRLRKLAESSQLSKKQVYRFMAWTELDLLRKDDERLDIRRLFEAYCEKGSRFWLDPSPWLKELDRVLELYAGKGPERQRVLSPFIDLLVECALNDINPTSFLQYIMHPRLGVDSDWRQWTERHLQPLTLIYGLLKKLREHPPFDRPVLGSGGNQLTRDVVLVKYGGKPLSFYSEVDLSNPVLGERYLHAWQDLNLDNAFTIFFMKANVLHFMYSFSGRISFQHLIAILEQMPRIEEGFRENFPSDWFDINVSAIPLSLYDYDIQRSISQRKDRGFKNTDFVRELRAYMKIIISLLQTSAGIYLCGFFAKRLTALKNPDIADTFASLVDVLHDNGGKHIYTWHVRQLLRKKREDRAAYIQYIVDNGGSDPEYPAPRDVFTDVDEVYYHEKDSEDVLGQLGITMEDIARSSNRNITSLDRREVTPGMILNGYMYRYPEKKEVIGAFIDEICAGEDRNWTPQRIEEIDSLGHALHYPILKRVIRGLGSLLFTGTKSRSFTGLYWKYSIESSKYFRDASVSFNLSSIDSSKYSSIDHKIRQQVRKQLDLKTFHQVWECLMENGTSIDGLIRHMNRMSSGLMEPIQKQQEEIIELTRDPDAIDEKLQKKISKKEKSLEVLQTQKAELDAVMDLFEQSPQEDMKFLLVLVVAGAKGKTGDEFTRELAGYMVRRYGSDPSIADRLFYLREDVPIELLTFEQAGWIINTVEALARHLNNDVNRILEKYSDREEEILEVTAPFLVTRSKRLDVDALDAAFRYMFSYNKMTGLLAQWQEIIEENNLQEKSRLDFSIFTSRTPLDAYFGDMGGICLSAHPEFSQQPGFINCRLVSHQDRAIVGMALLYLSPFTLHDYDPNSRGFWHAFAINPLSSLLNSLTKKNQLAIYLHFRTLFEKVAVQSGYPVVLSGLTTMGIVSNNDYLAGKIIALEKDWGAFETLHAVGLDVYYDESDFAHGLVIIDPVRKRGLHYENG